MVNQILIDCLFLKKIIALDVHNVYLDCNYDWPFQTPTI